ncbi:MULTISPECIES: bifunctional diguanylate cyclase/phosphodiesterase [Alphaproteobacteria]|uniref:Bifunctional diguanylate cyclase/phosphodiesterase n=2 Tax=Alphaproteobacteria TaxID=28211 RepID=A0A512HJF1_9HYPH|nr:MULTISPECIES: EAL domain-containing protein [Alphaproteobacteria]GEO85574.1 bifunctional diguanylate cyclase/phosphodiesterase [Ciceribacter naphthalenivorans]GLR22071.1 bifunctional diguanylate cyclase/phosphodiesterase [Ciceribacter naphthalenivorans]GLT04927.1 bifunctional diguanylate cyclase/phosphodiesterase [Sphingomonas psychrolutea]
MTESREKSHWGALGASLQYYIPAVIVVIAVAIAIFYADSQKNRLHQENLRNQVAEELGLIRARLEGGINANIQLVQGMVAVIETEPQITQERFATLARRIFNTPHLLRNLAAAPDLVIRFAYPLEGNERIIGFDYRKNPTQRDVALQVRETGRLVVTGPIDLIQGGRGLIARYPVVIGNGKGGRDFWGILSAVIDMDKLYVYGGLRSDGLGIDVTIAGKDRDGKRERTFYGDGAIFGETPVAMPINFGGESWEIAAVPKGGWDQPAPDLWLSRILMLLVGIMIVAPVAWVARLLKERHANIAALRQREEELRALSHRLEIALEASRIGVWELDIGSGELHWDTRMQKLYGVEGDGRCTYQTWVNALHPNDVEEAEQVLARALKSGKDYVTEFRVVTAGGEVRHIRAYGTTYRDPRFRKKLVGVNWNVTADIRLQEELREAKQQAELRNRELEQARQHMEHNSLHDALTNLPNRRYLDQHLMRLDVEGEMQAQATVLHIDLDRFKDINDTLGHGAGDAILKHVATKLRESTRMEDFVARIGGDEFVVVCADNLTEEQYGDLACRVIDAVNTPITYAGYECRVGASVGIATRELSDGKAEQLLVNADIALYEAKRHGRNRVEHYTDRLKCLTINTKKTADAILKSLEQNDFIAYFQPQFDAHTLEISGVEALARWNHPEEGILSPDRFLEIAESLNVVSQIDAAVLEQALLQRARWLANDLAIDKVSVNISAQRLFDENLLQRLEQLDVVPGSLSFELLESISFDDKGAAVTDSIERIKSHGIDIEIDDFGTGYASILSLLKLSPRRLKIDRQLTAPIIVSAAQRRLISSIVDIGRSLGIDIVAEGVETMQHAVILRDLGCHTLQGYALARPMDSNALIDFARARSWMPTHRAQAV